MNLKIPVEVNVGERKMLLKMKKTPGPGHNEGERSHIFPNP